MFEEIWKGVNGYEDSYEISNLGRVRSVARVKPRSDTGTLVSYPSKILKAGLDKRGYPRIRMGAEENKISKRVHRLVAEAFVPNPENKPQVNHIDGDKENNNWQNLEWVTNGENQRHALDTGLKIMKSGESAARFERFVDVFKNGEYITTLAGNIDMKEKGFDFRLVSACLKGKRNTHRGCTFKIKEEN